MHMCHRGCTRDCTPPEPACCTSRYPLESQRLMARLSPSLEIAIILKGHSASLALCGGGWGLLLCPKALPSLSHRSSYKHSPINFLSENPHLRIYFLKSPTIKQRSYPVTGFYTCGPIESALFKIFLPLLCVLKPLEYFLFLFSKCFWE